MAVALLLGGVCYARGMEVNGHDLRSPAKHFLIEDDEESREKPLLHAIEQPTRPLTNGYASSLPIVGNASLEFIINHIVEVVQEMSARKQTMTQKQVRTHIINIRF